MNKCNHQEKYPRLFLRLKDQTIVFLRASINRDAKVVEDFWHNDIKHIWNELSDAEAIKVLKILIKSRSEAAKYAWETQKIQTVWNSLSPKEILKFYNQLLKKHNVQFSTYIWENPKVKYAWEQASLKDSLNVLQSAFHNQVTSVSRSMFYKKISENFENITLEDSLSLLNSMRKDKNGDIIGKIGKKIEKEFERKNVDEMASWLKCIKNSKHKYFIKNVINSVENIYYEKINNNKTRTTEKILSNYSVLSNNFNKFGSFNFFKLNNEKSALLDELCMEDLNLPIIEKIAEGFKKNKPNNNIHNQINNFPKFDLLKSSKDTIEHLMNTNYANLIPALNMHSRNLINTSRKNSLSETESIKNIENQNFLKSPFFSLMKSFNDFLLTDEVLSNNQFTDKELSNLMAAREDSYISNLTELFNNNFTLFEICNEMKSRSPENSDKKKASIEKEHIKINTKNYTEDEKAKLLAVYNNCRGEKRRLKSIFLQYNDNNPKPRTKRAIETQVYHLDIILNPNSQYSDSCLGKKNNLIQIPKEDVVRKSRKNNIEDPSDSEQYSPKPALESPKI